MANMQSIGKYEDVIYQVKQQTYYVETKEDGTVITDETRDLPMISFRGTVKLHGTFAGVRYNKVTKKLTALSKGSELEIGNDNAGFAFFMEKHRTYFIDYMSTIPGDIEEVTLTGEWAGPGIQKKTGINLIPEKTFFMFGIKYRRPDSKDQEWAEKPETILGVISNGADIRSIYEFLTYDIKIDFNNPKEALEKIDKIKDEIDAECPVAYKLGFEGHGEGVVFIGLNNNDRYIFKHKGESHSKASKEKQPKEKDPREQEKLEFADKLTPIWRLDQAIQEIADTNNGGHLNMKMLGSIIEWVRNDIIKEEMETFRNSDFEMTDIQKFISKIVVDFVKHEITSEAMK